MYCSCSLYYAERGGGRIIVAEIFLDFVSGCLRQIMLILPADISKALKYTDFDFSAVAAPFSHIL